MPPPTAEKRYIRAYHIVAIQGPIHRHWALCTAPVWPYPGRRRRIGTAYTEADAEAYLFRGIIPPPGIRCPCK